VIITGILALMMTPGKWLETGGFFDGFFNPTYWPQLLYRTMMMLAIAAVFAALMAGYMKPGETRTYVVKTAGRWGPRIVDFLSTVKAAVEEATG
jgi:hypothetical protein